MDIRQALRTAVRNLFANKARFLHAVLGMLIGVAGFVLALSCTNLSCAYIDMQKNEYAPALLRVSTYVSVDLPKKILPQEIEQVAEDNPEVIKGISPYVEFELPGGVRYGERTEDEAEIYGVNGSFLEMVPVLRLREGRWLEALDTSRERKVCVIGSRIANDLLGGDALGQTLKIWGENYTVIGVLDEVEVEIERKRNSEVYIPYTNALKMVGDSITSMNNYQNIYFVWANDKENLYDIQVLLKDMLKKRTGREEDNGWSCYVTSMGSTSETIKGYVIAQAVQLMFCVSLVLLVGGTGIMNVMLASVQARTKEIGIRKAFGATAKDIQRQFALEAVITGLVGGLLGVIAGFVGMLVICQISEVPLEFLSVSIWPILAAVAVTVLVGVLSGLYPANKAAKMEIVDCISE